MPLASPHTINDREALAAIVSAAAVTASGLLVLLAYDLGPHSTHMALHIAAMSVLAPVTAALAADRIPRSLCNTSALWSSAAVQLALLWAWHVPAVQRVASELHALHVGALALLFACSFVFWSAVIRAASAARWHAIAALLVTGKLTCLISVLLIFSPRALVRRRRACRSWSRRSATGRPADGHGLSAQLPDRGRGHRGAVPQQPITAPASRPTGYGVTQCGCSPARGREKPQASLPRGWSRSPWVPFCSHGPASTTSPQAADTGLSSSGFSNSACATR